MPFRIRALTCIVLVGERFLAVVINVPATWYCDVVVTHLKTSQSIIWAVTSLPLLLWDTMITPFLNLTWLPSQMEER